MSIRQWDTVLKELVGREEAVVELWGTEVSGNVIKSSRQL